ncbi:MAG: glycoside hydrolase [Kiritimatiellales bacterium]|nr:glycoside hydrolase [Kiritimatiellales bacterium]
MILVSSIILPLSPAHGVDTSGVPGTVLDYEELSYLFSSTPWVFISDAEILVLENGTYLASHALAGWASGSDSSGETSIFRSTNQGTSWSRMDTIDGILRGSLVEHDGAVYLIGVQNDDGGGLVVCKSTDSGTSWTKSAAFSHGGAATPNNPVVFNNRLWSASSTASLSAPDTSNLLAQASWELTGGFPAYVDGWASEGQFIGEGQIAASPKQGVVILPKVKQHALSALTHVDSLSGRVSFDPNHHFVALPGGQKKFGAAYDAVSGSFYVLSNPLLQTAPAYLPSTTSANPDMIRNTAAMLTSKDLLNWNVEKIFLYSGDIDHEGFGYLNFDFAGDDMAVVARTSWDIPGETSPDDGRGGHDSNTFTFHKISDFRNASPDQYLTISGSEVLRHERTPDAKDDDVPLGPFALGSSFAGAALTNPNGFGKAANGDIYIRESGGRILRFDATGNFMETTNSSPVSFQTTALTIDPPVDGVCSWVNPGSGDWFEPGNWHYWNRADTTDETAIFGSAASGPATITVPTYSLEWLFDTDGDYEGWTLANITNTNVTGGALRGTPSSNDPQIKRTDLSFYGSRVSNVVIRMRADVNNSNTVLYWGTSVSNSYHSSRKINATYAGNGEFHDVVFSTAGHAQWDGQVIRRIRIDALNGPTIPFEVDHIAIQHNHHVKGIAFRNTQPYTLAGSQFLVIESDTGTGSLTVQQGDHEIQAALVLNSDTTFHAETNTSLRISGGLNLNGKTWSLSGAGDLIITNSFQLEGGTLAVVLGSVVTLDGDAGGFDGTLAITAPEIFSAAVGDSFHLIDGDLGTNRFDTVVLPPLQDGLGWDTSNLYSNGTVAVKLAVPASWMEDYELPTDGSADFIDSDGDGMDNYFEWLAGTVPTNVLSLFTLAYDSSAASSEGFRLHWNSLTNRSYRIDCSTNLMDSPAFRTLRSDIPGETGTTEFIDTDSVGKPEAFYRISIE